MDPADCPLPELVQVLQPYIKTREQVAAIRRALQRHLHAQTRKDDVPLNSINLSSPNVTELGNAPASLTGVRKAYWKSLEAHLAAQAKYDSLRAELARLKHPYSSEDNAANSRESTSEGYVALLRQREKVRKLKVLDIALSKITSADESASSVNLDDMVRKDVGDPPVPPTTQPSFNRDPHVDAKIMELKKAVVSNKRRLDQQRNQTIDQSSNGVHQVSVEAEVAGLQTALQELTTWMETQLTIIAEAEASTQPPEDIDRSDTVNGVQFSIENIEGLYQGYLEARRRLVQSINDTPEPDTHADSKDAYSLDGLSVGRRKNTTPAQTKSSAVAVLPFAPALLAAKAEEQSLVQQNAHMRRQLSSAEDECIRLIQRLADESHLVQPDAARGQHWADAAKEAGSATNQSIVERLEVGGAFVESARATHDAITSLSDSLAAS